MGSGVVVSNLDQVPVGIEEVELDGGFVVDGDRVAADAAAAFADAFGETDADEHAGAGFELAVVKDLADELRRAGEGNLVAALEGDDIGKRPAFRRPFYCLSALRCRNPFCSSFLQREKRFCWCG